MKTTKCSSFCAIRGGRSLAVIFSLAFACAGAANAEETVTPVYAVTSSGHNQQNTFGNASYWADYSTGTAVQSPHAVNSSNAAGLEYIITNNYTARTLATSANIYYGHVTVGTTDSPGIIGNKCYGFPIEYRGGLTVVNGQYVPINSGGTDDKEGKTTAQIAGTIEVLSPNTNPFWFGADNAQGVAIYADISGAEDTGLVIGGSTDYKWTNYKTITISGDNSQFLGSMEVGRASFITNFIGSATALGGAPSVLNEEAVKFSSKGDTTIVFQSAVGDCQIPATRGIVLNGVAGGSIYPRSFWLDLEEGANVEVLGPFKANGLCSNNRQELKIEKDGAGTLTLSGPVTLENAKTFTFKVNEGRVVLGSETARALTNELSNAVWIKSPSAEEFTVSGYTLSEGAGFVVRHENGAAGTIVLDSDCKIAATPINIQLTTDELGYDAYEVCVMKVPTSVRALTAEDFVDVDMSQGYDYPNTTFRIETADGVQSIYMSRAANNTIAHLTFETGFTSRVRKGTLSAAPTVTQSGSVLTNEVVFPRLTLHGDKETTLGSSTNSLGVNGGILNYADPGDLLKFDAYTIEFYIKAEPQYRWQGIMNLYNGLEKNPTVWSVLFDSSIGSENDRRKENANMRFSHSWVASEGEAPGNSGSAIGAQTVGDNKWHHIAYVISPNAADSWKTDLKYYIDYKLVGSATKDGRLCYEPSEGASFGIAVDSRWALGNKFDGLLDEIRITRGALEPEQFLQLRRERTGMVFIIR